MKQSFDLTIILGITIGLTAIGIGAWSEGLSPGFLWHPTAALIVGGGTLGAVIVRRGTEGVKSALRAVWSLRFADQSESHKVELARLAWLSRSVKQKGVKVLENHADSCGDALIAQGLLLIAEYADDEKLRTTLQRQINFEDELGLQSAETLEAAGAFAPTFGILGAVIGLIGVLRVIDQPSVLGLGIATAFVATIYGIGSANLFFFPLASRLRARHEMQMRRREEIALALLALAANESPRAIVNQFTHKV